MVNFGMPVSRGQAGKNSNGIAFVAIIKCYYNYITTYS